MIKIGLCEGTTSTGKEILFSYLKMGGMQLPHCFQIKTTISTISLNVCGSKTNKYIHFALTGIPVDVHIRSHSLFENKFFANRQ